MAKSVERMIKDFSPTLRSGLKASDPKMSDSMIDDAVNKWAERERRQSIEWAEKEYKAGQDFKRKILEEYNKGGTE